MGRALSHARAFGLGAFVSGVGCVDFAATGSAFDFEQGRFDECTAIPSPGIRKSAAWYGELTWSTAWPIFRYVGRLDVNIFDNGFGEPHGHSRPSGPPDGGSVWGTMIGEASGEDHTGGPCTLSYTPEKHAARFAAEYSAARKTLSLTVTQWLTDPGQYTISCGPNPGPHPYGSGSPFTPAMLDELLGNLAVAADGSVAASKEWPVPNDGRMRAAVTLQRGLQCRASQEGFVYASGVLIPVRSSPSQDSPLVAQNLPPRHGKLLYTRTAVSQGETWYYVQFPGGNGWVPQGETTCQHTPSSPREKVALGYIPRFGLSLSGRCNPGGTAAQGGARG
jgi:hypothetical protein